MSTGGTTEAKRYVLSFGGSLLYADQMLDLSFVRDMQTLLREQVARGNRFIVVVGGGYISRQYQKALKALDGTDTDLDWIGIHACRFNAQFVRLLLQDISHPELLLGTQELAEATAPIVFAGGIAPGGSSDYVSVTLAEAAGAQTIINMTNTSHVFDKDPATHPDAKAFDDLTWERFMSLIPSTWSPGLHAPFDPRAAAQAKQNGMEVAIVGKDVTNLRNLLMGEKFVGTTLHI